MKLSTLKPCFEGAVPATIVSCGKDGVPNCVNISQVWYVDDDHVAISRQFFKRTAQNLSENPILCVHVIDPRDGQSWALLCRFVRAEREGALFESMRAQLDVIASMSGMSSVFKLESADVFAVELLEKVPDCIYGN